MNRHTDTHTEVGRDGRMNERTDGRACGQTDGRRDGRTDGRTDGQTCRYTHKVILTDIMEYRHQLRTTMNISLHKSMGVYTPRKCAEE